MLTPPSAYRNVMLRGGGLMHEKSTTEERNGERLARRSEKERQQRLEERRQKIEQAKKEKDDYLSRVRNLFQMSPPQHTSAPVVGVVASQSAAPQPVAAPKNAFHSPGKIQKFPRGPRSEVSTRAPSSALCDDDVRSFASSPSHCKGDYQPRLREDKQSELLSSLDLSASIEPKKTPNGINSELLQSLDLDVGKSLRKSIQEWLNGSMKMEQQATQEPDLPPPAEVNTDIEADSLDEACKSVSDVDSLDEAKEKAPPALAPPKHFNQATGQVGARLLRHALGDPSGRETDLRPPSKRSTNKMSIANDPPRADAPQQSRSDPPQVQRGVAAASGWHQQQDQIRSSGGVATSVTASSGSTPPVSGLRQPKIHAHLQGGTARSQKNSSTAAASKTNEVVIAESKGPAVGPAREREPREAAAVTQTQARPKTASRERRAVRSQYGAAPVPMAPNPATDTVPAADGGSSSSGAHISVETKSIVAPSMVSWNRLTKEEEELEKSLLRIDFEEMQREFKGKEPRWKKEALSESFKANSFLNGTAKELELRASLNRVNGRLGELLKKEAARLKKERKADAGGAKDQRNRPPRRSGSHNSHRTRNAVGITNGNGGWQR